MWLSSLRIIRAGEAAEEADSLSVVENLQHAALSGRGIRAFGGLRLSGAGRRLCLGRLARESLSRRVEETRGLFCVKSASVDHVVGQSEYQHWDIDAQRGGGPLVDDELEASRLLHRQLGRIGALKNAVNTVIGRPVMSDKDYCAALARKWRSYSRTGAQGPAPQAIAACDAGNYDEGITVLEQVLTDDRIVLPSRYL